MLRGIGLEEWQNKEGGLCLRLRSGWTLGLRPEHLLALPSMEVGWGGRNHLMISSPYRPAGQSGEGQPGPKGRHGQSGEEKDRADFSKENDRCKGSEARRSWP